MAEAKGERVGLQWQSQAGGSGGCIGNSKWEAAATHPGIQHLSHTFPHYAPTLPTLQALFPGRP